MTWTPEQHRAYLERRATIKESLTVDERLENAFLPDDQVREKSSCASLDDQIEAEMIRDEVKSEKDLHRQIAQECHRRGWIAFHGSMARRTSRVAGEPDFIILPSNHGCHGKVLFVECKRPGGRLSEEQQEMIDKAAALGHAIHVVTRFQQFLALL